MMLHEEHAHELESHGNFQLLSRGSKLCYIFLIKYERAPVCHQFMSGGLLGVQNVRYTTAIACYLDVVEQYTTG